MGNGDKEITTGSSDLKLHVRFGQDIDIAKFLCSKITVTNFRVGENSIKSTLHLLALVVVKVVNLRRDLLPHASVKCLTRVILLHMCWTHILLGTTFQQLPLTKRKFFAKLNEKFFNPFQEDATP